MKNSKEKEIAVFVEKFPNKQVMGFNTRTKLISGDIEAYHLPSEYNKKKEFGRKKESFLLARAIHDLDGAGVETVSVDTYSVLVVIADAFYWSNKSRDSVVKLIKNHIKSRNS